MSRTSDRSYRRARARVLAPARIWCALCGEEIDKTLAAPHPMSPTADHVDPVAAGGSNTGPLVPAHLGCNSSRGARDADVVLPRAQRLAASPEARAAARREERRTAFRW